ncbi:sulfite exporter TauE/SafE family protein [Herbaspirillum sp. WKF16]|uniref:sulfite exporter TauE/SafE family protein n=1 Tax=Herbaspirillum sp. WKF16 TaxID=3028312 RepID=UPI0023A9B84F|nr:sulfite exporter TauE/SafE family protein [Herbaspirillum sp. WKF16]WDZ94370.1 sulfite exporter TauE/SafE family protein [Herbaspirillum sp. WKF16]
MAAYLFVLAVGLLTGMISGVIGTGSSIMLLPVLVYNFGPKRAVPIMAVAAVMANLSRVMAWWRAVDWRAFAAYSVTGVPAAILGARTLLRLPAHWIDIGLGVFFLAMVPVRHWLKRRNVTLKLWQLSLCGAVIGYLTGIVLSTGPLSVPAFTSYGLAKGAFLSTEAASSLALYVSKVLTFRELGAMPLDVFLQGVLVGSSLMAGTFAGRAFVMKMSERHHQRLLDALLVASGLSLLWAAIHGA